MQEDEAKKNYYGVYGVVIALYITMIIVYAVVVHKATENGAADNVACVPSSLNECPDVPTPPASMVQNLMQTIFA